MQLVSPWPRPDWLPRKGRRNSGKFEPQGFLACDWMPSPCVPRSSFLQAWDPLVVTSLHRCIVAQDRGCRGTCVFMTGWIELMSCSRALFSVKGRHSDMDEIRGHSWFDDAAFCSCVLLPRRSTRKPSGCETLRLSRRSIVRSWCARPTTTERRKTIGQATNQTSEEIEHCEKR